MNRLTVASAVLPLFVMGAAAQNVVTIHNPLASKVMGTVVKGAPYSADEITESLQILGDGTRISNQNQVTVYRDGEGRVRRETPQGVEIWDPVGNVSYSLDPKTMTAMKSPLGMSVQFYGDGASGQKKFYFSSSSSGTSVQSSAEGKAAAETQAQALAIQLDKLKAELEASQTGMMVNGSIADPRRAAAVKADLEAAMTRANKVAVNPAKAESLGQQVMSGVAVEGTRSTSTMDVGTIGNDRPINTVSERWYSADLQTVVMTKHSDPRTGEETFRLANIRRGEPGVDLFMVPPGYTLMDTPAAIKMIQNPAAKKEQ